MNDSRQHLEILYEISMAIGGETACDRTLETCLPLFLRRLGCNTVGVLKGDVRNGFEVVHVLPYRVDIDALLPALQRALEHSEGTDHVQWKKAKNHYYAWPLPDFGQLVLGRSRPLDEFLVHEIGLLAKKLSLALLSCEQFVQLQQTREQLALEAELNRTTLLAIGEALIATDRDLCIRQINPAARELIGEHRGEIVGRPLGEFVTLFRDTPDRDLRIDESSEPIDITAQGSGEAILQCSSGLKVPVYYNIRRIQTDREGYGGIVMILRDIRERRAMEARIGWQATHDALTGLPNRVLLADRLKQAVALADRHERLLAVALIDLDEFKPVNDRLGHEAGDRLLKMAACRMQALLRPSDTLARLGGDEFVIVLEELKTMGEAEQIFERIIRALATPFEIGEQKMTLSASLGYTLYPLLDESDGDTLLRNADQAMYSAKRAGRNRCQLFDAMEKRRHEISTRRLYDIREGLRRQEFELHYQPKVDMRRGTIQGFEALVRWRHPEQGLLTPGEFIDWVQQDHQLERELGRYVLKQACRQIKEWRGSGHPWQLAVNVSPRHFLDSGFLDDLDKALGCPPEFPENALELEIVESAAIHELEAAIRVIEACHRRKVTVALDDFGVGYASLSYLRNLPVDRLKIDRSFVRDLLDDPDDLALAESIITLASLFGRAVIAEGVETAEQGTLLMRLGCDHAQGFGISPPLLPEAVEGWAGTWRPDPGWALWADVRWELSDFPLLVAQYDHLRWVKRILRTVDGHLFGMSAQELEDHHHCRLGHWYDTHGKRRYGHLPAYRAIYPVHKAVHRTGREIVRLVSEGKREEAEALGKELLHLKEQILDHLVQLQREVAESIH